MSDEADRGGEVQQVMLDAVAVKRKRCADIVRAHLGHVSEGGLCAQKILREIEGG